jgi:pimeloyl-ACP methyl ester carboxylesterase
MSLIVQDVDVHLVDRGAGMPILFLHGVPDSSAMWAPIVEQLESRYRCLAPDLPGLGRSSAPAQFEISLDNMARFIDGLLIAIGIAEPINLVAGDFGATYGLAWAVTYPTKVRRIAIVGGSNFSSAYRWHRDARMLRAPLLGELGMATLRESTFERMMRRNAPALSREHVRQTYALSLAKPSVRRMVLRLYRGIAPDDFKGWEERLRTLTESVPTLVLWGNKDPYITPDLAEQFGAAQVEHFPNNGHWLAVEDPGAVAQRLASFFA